MDRQEAEKMIASCLEIIRIICKEFKPDYDICSMYVTPHSASAFITDDDRDDYDLKYDWMEVDEE